MNPIKPPTMKIAFFTNHGPDAMATLRLIGPTKMLEIEVELAYQIGKINIDKIKDCNLFIHQRDFCKDFDAYKTMVSYAHDEKIPVIFDLDDLLFELPENHPDRKSGFFTAALLPMLQAVFEADAITVSTQCLADYLSPYNSNIHVIPNFLNDEIWKIDTQLNQNKTDSDNVVIGYMGGHSHQPDLAMVLPVLLRVTENYHGNLRFKFIGIQAPPELESISETLWINPESYIYANFADFFKSQKLDIAIAPICENLFNTCKSGIKYLEYSAIGVPAIYSAIPPYKQMIQNGFNGILANSEDEWLNALIALIEKPDLRKRLVENAQKDIRDKWLLSNNLKVFSEFYQQMSNFEVPTHSPHAGLKHMISMINPQLFETFTIKNNTINEQKHEFLKAIEEQKQQFQNTIVEQNEDLQKAIVEKTESKVQLSKVIQENIDLKNSLNSVEDELITLHLSKSWRITRPLRKFIGFFKKRLT
ncbi:MAG: hypothetical protein BGO78_00050 [Chloroflexi bacterium 44-23]|nr:MAG: hypothetical protein BGO78_00050 [Chloroflexi bacterium 44-23]